MPDHAIPLFILCEECGATVRIPPSRLGRRRFCSRECMGAHFSRLRGAQAPHYKGARTIFNGGHIVITRPDGGGVVQEHRYVMEQHLGRPLERNEIVHHIDGNPANNELSNLAIMTNAEHSRLHNALRRLQPKVSRWSPHGDCCVRCGTTERKHQGNGLCRRCYMRDYQRKHKAA